MRGDYISGKSNKPGQYKHGFRYTPEYKSWQHMKDRCLNPKCNRYKYYGARGITVCKEWMNFETFISDMGTKPTSRHTIGRIDNNGNYEPKNCRWENIFQQRNNQRNNHPITYKGRTLTIAEWAREKNLNYSCLRNRIKKGWPLDKALQYGIYWKNQFQKQDKGV